MAQESCNRNKDEAEFLKPNSAPSSPTSQSAATASTSPPPSLFLKNSEQIPSENTDLLSSECLQQVAVLVPAKPHTKQEHLVSDKSISRCLICHRKVGLTGFQCRCGDLFCSHHRYSGTHDCSYNYKAAGREEIARANPVVRATKIIKI